MKNSRTSEDFISVVRGSLRKFYDVKESSVNERGCTVWAMVPERYVVQLELSARALCNTMNFKVRRDDYELLKWYFLQRSPVLGKGMLPEPNLCCAVLLSYAASLFTLAGEQRAGRRATLRCFVATIPQTLVCLESLQALRGSTSSKSPCVICNEICLCACRRQQGQIIQLHN